MYLLTVNKIAKYLLAGKYQDCYANEVLKQLTRGVEPHEVNVDVIQVYHSLKSSKNIDFLRFKKAYINQAIKKVNSLINVCNQCMFISCYIGHIY